MGYGINHYTYQNIVDPARPRPPKPERKVPPRMTDAQKAEAIARILAVKNEIETREAAAVARVKAVASKIAAEPVIDLAEAKKVLRAAQVKAAQVKYREKIAAEEDEARDALLALGLRAQSEGRAKIDARKRSKQKAEAQLVSDYRAGIPTALELVEEAKRAALIERVERRKERRRESERRRTAKHREKRQSEKRARLDAEAAQVDEQLRALANTEEQVLALEAYLARSQSCRDAYYHRIGVTLSDEEETLKERAVKARLLLRLRADPDFLNQWRVTRTRGSIANLPEFDQDARRADNRKKTERARERKLEETVGNRASIEARLATLSENPNWKWAITEYVRNAVKYGQRWRVHAKLDPWTEEELDIATLRAKLRLLDRVAVEPDYLDQWYAREKKRRSECSKRKIERIKADPEQIGRAHV